jgi:hypothetical protein
VNAFDAINFNLAAGGSNGLWGGINVGAINRTGTDACDGSQVGGLSKLEGSRTRPRETNSGYYLIPLFVAAERK